MRVPSLALLCSLTALAQQPTIPEIRGTVVETGVAIPIPGAEVVLYEFAPNQENFIVRTPIARTSTGSDGAFVLRPDHVGSFIVGATKDGFRGPTTEKEAVYNLDLKAGVVPPPFRLSLTRPALLTGRVVDRDGNPVAGVRLEILDRTEALVSYPIGRQVAVSDAEGRFSRDVQPGAYILHVQPKEIDAAADLPEFNEAAFKIVEEDVDSSYWPGDLSDPKLAVPIQVAGGAVANAGTIVVRKVPYYRVRLTMGGECGANERWYFRLFPAGSKAPPMDRYSACRTDALLTGIPRGSYQLAVWSGRDASHWALTPFTVTDANTTARLSFSESAKVTGRIVAAEGSDLKALGAVQVMISSRLSLPSGSGMTPADAQGNLVWNGIAWPSHWTYVLTLNPTTYVKEVRYNGLPLRSPYFQAAPGGVLEAVLDSGAASVTASVKGAPSTRASFVLIPIWLTELPDPLANFPPFVILGPNLINSATLTAANVPPGEYRLLTSFPEPIPFADPAALAQRLARAETIKLGRGEQKVIELDPRP